MTRYIALPVELLTRTFDLLALEDLDHAILVCRSWRFAGRECFAYWRDVGLSSISRIDIQLFRVRLKYKPSSCVRICVSLSEAAQRDGLVAEVLPLVKKHLNRVEQLRLSVHVGSDDDVFCALHGKAPNLSLFALEFTATPGERFSYFLPLDIFCCHAPRLRQLRLHATVHTYLPDAFREVTDFSFSIPSLRGDAFPFSFVDQMPSLRQLEISGGPLYFSPYWPSSIYEPVLTGLGRLRLAVRNGIPEHFLHLPAFAVVPQIITTDMRRSIVQILLSHLVGNLDVEARMPRSPRGSVEKRFTLCYSEQSGRCSRTFEASLFRPSPGTEDAPCSGFDIPDVHCHIISLSIDAIVWFAMRKVSGEDTVLPRCLRVTLYMDRSVPLGQLGTALPLCPVLDTLEMCSESEVLRYDAMALRSFLDPAFLRGRTEPAKLEVVLKRIAIDGPVKGLEAAVHMRT
ncbi:hypothetical protein EXIGLDRAFT_721683 [Exidia glandulosa HHB12029]|uniref:F-box domain-containing protein n=1 Tax=Exidia glandulosa HHB12029 TaxID=1314781 RepID=A0A165QCV8_EXIGL|nr:hypothetical protein EXIGLDRAFT_721683 [Exidia glandulosa HHB12029]